MTNTKTDSIKDLMSVVNSTEIGLVIFDKNYNVRIWNLFMVNHSNIKAEGIMGLNIFEQFPSLPKSHFEQKVQQCITGKNKILSTWEEQAYWFEFKNVRTKVKFTNLMYQNITFIPLVSANGEVGNFAITIHDVTDIVASTQQLEVVVKGYIHDRSKDN